MDSHGNEPQIGTKAPLEAIVKHINREFIDAFYKATKAKFIVVLKQKKNKDIFTHEKKFIERIHDIIFRILPRLPKVNDRDGGKDIQTQFLWQCSYQQQFQMLLWETLSWILVQCIPFMQASMIKILRESKMEKDILG